MKKAELLRAVDSASARVLELEKSVERFEIERAADLAELTVADATLDAARARISALEATCENLQKRIAMTERERDGVLAGVRAASPGARTEELEERLLSFDTERTGFVAESQTAAEHLDALAGDRIRAEARIAELEARLLAVDAERRDELEERLLSFDTERARFVAESQTAAEHLDALAEDRVRAQARIGELEARIGEFEARLLAADAERRDDEVAARADRTRFEALEARLATVARARKRLFEGTLRAAEQRAQSERRNAEQAATIDRLALERADLESAIKRAEGGRAKAEYELENAHVRLGSMQHELDRFKTAAQQAEDAIRRIEPGLAHSAEIIASLAVAHRHAAESLASLELSRVRLEYDLATRAGAAEASASEAALAASRLRGDRALLLDTIALRERRIAALESTLREIAHDMIRTAEAERERYRAMHHALLSSKIVKVRDAIRNVLRWPPAWRARVLPAVTRRTAKRRPTRASDKRPRHLRSA